MPRLPTRCGLVLAALPLLAAACRSSAPPPPSDVPAVGLVEPGPVVAWSDDARPLDEPGALPARIGTADAVRRALLASAELQAAGAAVRAAAAEARQARLLPNPLFSMSFRLAEAGASPALDLGLAQDLYALLTRDDATGEADARLRAEVEAAAAVALDVAGDAALRVADVRAADARVPLLAARAELLGRVRALAVARVDGGEGRPLDVAVVDEELAVVALDVAEAQAAAREARLALAARLGRPGDAGTFDVDASPVRADGRTEAEWIAVARERRPELRAASWEIAALEAALRRAGHAPREGTEAGLDAEGTKDWSAGPAVSVPLPLWDDGSAAADAAGARLAAARHRRTAVERDVVAEVRAASSAHAAAEAALALARDRLLPAAERRRADAEAVFRSGEGDLTDVLLAEQALTDARLRIAGLQALAERAAIRLLRAAGGAGPAAAPLPETTEGAAHAAR